MNEPLKLLAGGKWYGIDELENGISPEGLSAQEIKATQFCYRWLNGVPTFQFSTSGSTGLPRKISFNREQLEVSARLTADALGLQRGWTALICLDVQLIAGAMMIVRSLVTGMNMIIRNPSANPFDSLTDPAEFTALVPYQLLMALEKNPLLFNQFKIVIVGGAPLSPETSNRLQILSPSFYATYGMTETITHVALQKLNRKDRQDYFQLLPGIHASTDARNCLVIRASHLGKDPIITNDVVMLLNERQFRWIGRADHVINSGGVKIQAEKIEHALDSIINKLSIQRRLFVAGLPDPKLGEKSVIVVEGLRLTDEQENLIRMRMNEELNKYEAPKTFCYVPRFVETATQKVDRIETLKLIALNR